MSDKPTTEEGAILSLVSQEKKRLVQDAWVDYNLTEETAWQNVAALMGEPVDVLKKRVFTWMTSQRPRPYARRTSVPSDSEEGLSPEVLQPAAIAPRNHASKLAALREDLKGLKPGNMRLICFGSIHHLRSTQKMLSNAAHELNWKFNGDQLPYHSNTLPARMNGQPAWILRVDRLS